METRIEKVNPDVISAEVLQAAAAVIQAGGLVAFPTETVYGLGADAFLPQAARDIYAAKGRPSDNPLIVHIAAREDLDLLTKTVPERAEKLMDAFWPGPLTMIFEKSDALPFETTGGLSTVAVRMPSHPVARELIKTSGRLIAAPSANASGRPSPTKAAHVIEDLDGKVDMILDAGDVFIGLESTIIDFTTEVPTVLRPGFVTAEELRGVLGEIHLDPAVFAKAESKEKPKAPGMRYRHYAPKAPLVVLRGKKEAVVREINARCAACAASGGWPGVLCSDETADLYPKAYVFSLGAAADEAAIAKQLFAALRAMDAKGVTAIYSEAFDTPRLGAAIMNRLLKAAGYQVVDV